MKSISSKKAWDLKGPLSTVRGSEELQFYCNVLIRIRLESVRPADSGCEASISVTECSRDIASLQHRISSEGLSFLTKTLPSLGKALDRALLGDSNAFVSLPFKKARDSRLPVLFGDLLRRVLNSNGTVRTDADGQSVRLLRQLTYSFYKLDVPYDSELNEKVIKEFCQVDKDLPILFYEENTQDISTDTVIRLMDLPGSSKDQDGFRVLGKELSYCAKIARHVIALAIGHLDPRDIRPRHGPGAVATGERGPEKVHLNTVISRLERVYPYMDYMKYNLGHVCDTWMTALRSEEYGTAKVVLVPKDSRGPRLISCEPLTNQWIQQGQMSLLVETLEKHWLTKGQVNFTDQSTNGILALRASLTGEHATLDMKEASDRVSWALVELLFPKHWVEALWASRSAATKLPNGEVIRLNKFAPMGSAVCFPVEALCFFALAIGAVYCKQIRLKDGGLALLNAKPYYLEKGRIREIAESIFVYGDDIICRTEDCGSIKEYLSHFALRFNEDKCCTRGFFRESCGVDAFKGVDVTPVKFRRRLYPSQIAPDAYLSWVEYSNSLFEKGFWHSANIISETILKQIDTPTLCTLDGRAPSRKGGVFFYRPYPGSPRINKRRFNRKLQCHEALAYTVVPAKAYSTNLGWSEMLRCETLTSDHAGLSLTGRAGKKAGVYAVPRSYKLKRGWVSIDSCQ